ncbi:MAG: HEAT repeat domain-containing protein [Planctomycetota bacterium]
MADERIRELERRAAGGDAAARAALAGARRREGGRAEFASWRALFAAGADLYLPLRLGAGLDGLATADLAPLGPARARRARAFLEDGREPAILDELAQDPGAGADLGLLQPRGQGAEVRPRALVSALRDPAGLLRLSLIYEAAGGVGAYHRGQHAELTSAGLPQWLLALFNQAEARPLPAHSPWSWPVSSSCAFGFETLRSVLAAARLPLEPTFRTLLGFPRGSRSYLEGPRAVFAGCPGLGEALAVEFPELVREALEGEASFEVCRVLRRQRAPLGPWIVTLTEAATEDRAAGEAWQLLLAAREQGLAGAVRAALIARLEHPRSEVRWRAVRGLDRFAHPSTVAALQRAAEADKSQRVRHAAAGVLSTLRVATAAPEAAPRAQEALPPLPPMDPDTLDRLREALAGRVPESTARAALEALVTRVAWPLARGGREAGDDPALSLASREVLPGSLAALVPDYAVDPAAHLPLLSPLAVGLDLPRRVRLLHLTGHLTPGRRRADGIRGWIGHVVLDRLARELGPDALSLDALERALGYAGIEPTFAGHAALDPQASGSPFSVAEGWAAGGYYGRHPRVIDHALRGGLTATHGFQAWASRLLTELEAVFAAQEAFAPSWVEALVELGTDTPKAKRAFAQRVLDRRPELDLRALLAPQLRARKGDRRASAAAWLARRGEVGARPDLEAAVARERMPKVRRALEAALAALNRPSGS